MKKFFLSLVAFCAMTMSVSAQGELETYSRYDVNHKDGVNVTDVTEVVNRAKKVNGDESQVVDAEALNAVLKDIYAAISELKTLKSSVEAVRNEVSKLLQNALPDDYHEYVDLGFGPKWATMNVGAENAYEAGLYVQWGATAAQTEWTGWPNYFDWAGTSSGIISCKIYHDSEGGYTTLMSVHDFAAKSWGGTWRIPTSEEWQALIDNCTLTWNQWDHGYNVVSKINGKSIFLPATGYYGDGPDHEKLQEETAAYYWTSSYCPDNYGHHFAYCFFGADGEEATTKWRNRTFVLPVRPVCD